MLSKMEMHKIEELVNSYPDVNKQLLINMGLTSGRFRYAQVKEIITAFTVVDIEAAVLLLNPDYDYMTMRVCIPILEDYNGIMEYINYNLTRYKDRGHKFIFVKSILDIMQKLFDKGLKDFRFGSYDFMNTMYESYKDDMDALFKKYFKLIRNRSIYDMYREFVKDFKKTNTYKFMEKDCTKNAAIGG